MGNRLYRSRTNKVIMGVCGGIGEYFNIDPTIIRIIWVLVGFAGMGIPAYIIAAIVIPERKDEFGGTYDDSTTNSDFGGGYRSFDVQKTGNVLGIILIVLGVLFLGKQIFHWFDMKIIIPVVLIAVGALIISNGRNRF